MVTPDPQTLTGANVPWLVVAIVAAFIIIISDILDGIFDFLPDDMVQIGAVFVGSFAAGQAVRLNTLTSILIASAFTALAMIVSYYVRSRMSVEVGEVQLRVGDVGSVNMGFVDDSGVFMAEVTFAINGVNVTRMTSSVNSDRLAPGQSVRIVSIEGDMICVEPSER